MPIPFLFQQQTGLAKVLNGSQLYAPRTSSITQTRGSGTPTITRATVATVMGYGPTAVLADGQTLLTVASGELRFQGARRISEGVWSDVDAAGVLIPAATLDGSVVEAAATNSVLWSQEFDNASWVKGSGNVAANATVAPDGTTTADKFTPTATTAPHYLFSNVVANLASPTESVYIKANGYTKFALRESATTGAYASFELSGDGVILDSAGAGVITAVNPVIESVGNGWYRASAGMVGTVSHAIGIWVLPDSYTSGAPAGNWTANGTAGVYVWEANLVGSAAYASSPITTTTAAATRNKDVLDDQVSGNLTAAAGSVAFQWTPSHAPSGTVALCGSYVDASNYTALLHDGTKYILRKRIAGVNYDAELTAAFVSGTTYDIALYWGASGSNLAVDGVLGTSHANTTAAQLGTRWQWGADGNGGQQAGAAIKEKFMWTRALSDSELQAVTA